MEVGLKMRIGLLDEFRLVLVGLELEPQKGAVVGALECEQAELVKTNGQVAEHVADLPDNSSEAV